MPGGQWVAFEGYETLHDCKKATKQSRKTSNYIPEKNPPEYEQLDFVDFKSAQEPPSGEDNIKDPINYDVSNSNNIPSWVWWLSGIILFILAGVLLNL